jgi:hypothetical protein
MEAVMAIEPTVPEDVVIAAYLDCRWRVGRKVGRTIYAVIGDEPSDDDELIGVMDSPELAAEAVHGHNCAVSLRERGF